MFWIVRAVEALPLFLSDVLEGHFVDGRRGSPDGEMNSIGDNRQIGRVLRIGIVNSKPSYEVVNIHHHM